MCKKVLLVGQYKDDHEFMEVIRYLKQFDHQIYVNKAQLQEISMHTNDRELQNLYSWSFFDIDADFCTFDDLITIYCMAFEETIDKRKLKNKIGCELPTRRTLLRYSRSYGEKNEVIELYLATILDVDEILYFNMKSLKLFLPENQLLYRRQGYRFLARIESNIVEMNQQSYKLNRYRLEPDIVFYQTFSAWLKEHRSRELFINIISNI